MAASITRWRLACCARVRGRTTACCIGPRLTARTRSILDRIRAAHGPGTRGRDGTVLPMSTVRAARPPDPDDVVSAMDVATTDGRVPGQRGRATRQRLLDATAE